MKNKSATVPDNWKRQDMEQHVPNASARCLYIFKKGRYVSNIDKIVINPADRWYKYIHGNNAVV